MSPNSNLIHYSDLHENKVMYSLSIHKLNHSSLPSLVIEICVSAMASILIYFVLFVLVMPYGTNIIFNRDLENTNSY